MILLDTTWKLLLVRAVPQCAQNGDQECHDREENPPFAKICKAIEEQKHDEAHHHHGDREECIDKIRCKLHNQEAGTSNDVEQKVQARVA